MTKLGNKINPNVGAPCMNLTTENISWMKCGSREDRWDEVNAMNLNYLMKIAVIVVQKVH